jgi:hypothetical protein
MKKGYVWYSFGSDKSGPELGTALDFDAGKKTPPFDKYEIVLGWGCKAGSKYNPEGLAQLVAQGKVRILNHPDMVERNRDKLGTLARMKELGIAIPGFFSFDPSSPVVAAETLIPDALVKGVVALPLIIHNSVHKGDPILCYTMEDVAAALQSNSTKENPFSYVRTYDHGDEYRVHVFRDAVMFAQKKVLEEDPVAAAAESLFERVKAKWSKEGRGVGLGEQAVVRDTAMFLAGDILKSASKAQKSISMGWKFMDWNMELVPQAVAALAIEALDGVHLDLGAVSISYTNKTPRVLSITTAPTLSPEHMASYAVQIKTFIEKGGKTKVAEKKGAAKKKEGGASPELVARLYRKVKDLSAEKAEAILKSLEE